MCEIDDFVARHFCPVTCRGREIGFDELLEIAIVANSYRDTHGKLPRSADVFWDWLDSEKKKCL